MRNQSWRKPTTDTYKANWDVAVNSDGGKVSVGAIVRDHRGCVMGTLCANRPSLGSVFDAEALGLLLTILFCKELGITNVVFERDS